MANLLENLKLSLRPMTLIDLEAVLEVEQQAYEYPWTRKNFLDCLHARYHCWIWQLDDRIIGHGVMSVGGGECEILNLCTHPEWQHQGLGGRMLTRLLSLCRNCQADTAFLEVRSANLTALNMYRKAGFNEVGLRRGYYPHSTGRMDAVILAKTLLS